jgi:hypothetical protein
MADSTKGNEEGSREQMEVRMHRLIVTIALLGAGGILATWEGPTLAAEAVTAPGVQLVGGYKYCDYNGCYYCQRRECETTITATAINTVNTTPITTAQVMAVVAVVVATVISRGVPGRTNGRLRPPVSF